MQADPVQLAREAGRKLHHFHGGLRLRHNKKVSCETPVEKAPLPPRLYVPLLQHSGREAEAVVKPRPGGAQGRATGLFHRAHAGLRACTNLGNGNRHCPPSHQPSVRSRRIVHRNRAGRTRRVVPARPDRRLVECRSRSAARPYSQRRHRRPRRRRFPDRHESGRRLTSATFIR